MNRENILKKINEIFQDVFDDENIALEEITSPDDIEGWDSLEHINLVVSVESQFGIKFTIDEVGKMKNVGEMINLIQDKV